MASKMPPWMMDKEMPAKKGAPAKKGPPGPPFGKKPAGKKAGRKC